MKYIDIHTHRLPEKEQGNVVRFLNLIVGQSHASDYPSHFPFSAGIHPWYIEGDGQAQLEALWEVARQPEVWMIGEAGLDKTRPDLPFQQTLFEEQALMAEELRKPLVIHGVKCWAELTEIRRRLRPTSAWVIHGFRGKSPQARQLLQEGFFLSFGEIYHDASLQAAYPHRFFLETDESTLSVHTLYLRASTALSVPLAEVAKQAEMNLESIISY